MRSPESEPSEPKLVIWAAPKVRKTFHAIAQQAGWRRLALVADERELRQALTGAAVALIDEHLPADPLDLMARAACGQLGPELPPFILMVSEPTRATVETALSAGFGSVIAKPFSAQTLSAHISRAIAAGGPPVLRDDQFFID